MAARSACLANRPIGHSWFVQTFKQLQARNRDMETLHQMGLDLGAALDLDKVLETIMLTAVDLLEADTGGLFLYQAEEDVLELVVRHSHFPLPLGYKLSVGQGVAGKVWASNKPLLVDDYQQMADHIPALAALVGNKSSIGVPIGYQTEKIGVLAVIAKDDCPYTWHDVELLTLFAPSVALAIRNAQFYKQVQAELVQRQQIESQLQTVINSAPLILFMLDQEGIFQIAEGKGLAHMGLETGKVVGRSVFEVYEDIPNLATNIQRVLAGETFNALVQTHSMVFNTWFSPRYDSAHNPSGVLGVALDVTTHQQAANALHRRNEYLAALHQISLDLLNRRDQQSLLEGIVERAANLFEAAYCSLVLWDGTDLIIRATTHKHLDQVGKPIQDHEGIMGQVYATGQPLIVNEYARWFGRRPALSSLQLQTAAVVPVVIDEQCIGTLGLARTDSGYFFDSEQLYLINLFAQLVALVLDQAQLYEAVQHELVERKRIQEDLRESEEWLRAIIASMEDLVLVLDRQGKFLDYYQPKQRNVFYLPSEQFLGKSYTEVLPTAVVEGLTAVLQKVTESGQVEKFEYALSIEGQERWFSANVSGRNNHHDQFDGVTIVVRDISDYKQSAEQLRQIALYDELTSLPNRRLLIEELDKAIANRHVHHFALLFLDLDRFKIINDSLGHQIGDNLLIAIARLLERCVRQHDIVARLGGDEFVVLLTQIHNELEVQRVAERILERMSHPFFLNGHTVYTSASIGLIARTVQYEHSDEVLRHADIAMYQAKIAGKARYELFDLSQQSQAADLWQIERDLRQALEQDELVVFYQPIVSLANGQLSGIEALVRWQHPQRGLLDPGIFLPVAEEAGLIVAVNERVLQEACRQLQEWHQLGYDPPRLTVNISAIQLQQANSVTFIQDTLEQARLPYHTLGLEITERFSARTKEHIPALNALHDQGVGILIDDFGIGSSLESLKLFPLDYLKINQSFVQGMTRDVHDQAIIKAIIAMAHSLGLQVIAEGVETVEQLTYLQAEGCDEVQGFFIAPPMPAIRMSQWLQHKASHTLDVDSPSRSLDVAIRAHFAEHIGYALVDATLAILKSNDTMRQWITAHVDKLDGQLVTDAFPSLVGLEEAMLDLITNPRLEPLVLSRVFCPGADEFGHYYDLRVEPFVAETAVLLLIAQDVTRQARQEFALRQQLNELRLMISE